ncbi:hypothetical protein DFH09DRAFT_1218094 [Mycena vulgaris]|nr:hypothetical protein DFH09DRAFT_1218094 [Mycena vulgaris]
MLCAKPEGAAAPLLRPVGPAATTVVVVPLRVMITVEVKTWALVEIGREEKADTEVVDVEEAGDREDREAGGAEVEVAGTERDELAGREELGDALEDGTEEDDEELGALDTERDADWEAEEADAETLEDDALAIDIENDAAFEEALAELVEPVELVESARGELSTLRLFRNRRGGKARLRGPSVGNSTQGSCVRA